MKKNIAKLIDNFSNKLHILPEKLFSNYDLDDEKSIKHLIIKLLVAAQMAICLSIFLFIFFFSIFWFTLDDNSVPNIIGTLGTTGDFFGGILNPFFAFSGFIAILYTLRINQKELSQVTLEMKKTSESSHIQIKQDEVQHLLETQVSSVDLILDSVFIVNDSENGNNREISFTTLITEENGYYGTALSKINQKESLVVINDLISSLLQLEKITAQHSEITNSKITRKFYATKYLTILKKLYNGNHLIQLKNENMKNYLSLLLFSTHAHWGKESHMFDELNQLLKTGNINLSE